MRLFWWKQEPKPKTSLTNEDRSHLTWLYFRLLHVHGENELVDYMQKMKEIIE